MINFTDFLNFSDGFPSEKRSRTRMHENAMKLFRNLAMSRLMKRSEESYQPNHQQTVPDRSGPTLQVRNGSLSPKLTALWKTRVG